MAETYLYDIVDRRTWVFQPSFTRWNHRYRGQRESYKFNAEISAMCFDMRKLRERLENINQRLQYRLGTMIDGGTVPGAQYYWAYATVPALTNYSPVGVDVLNIRLARLRSRVEDLEVISG